MKKITFFLAFICLPLFVSAQSFTQLVKEYESECARIVPDTTEQTGVVTFDIVPTFDSKGKVSHYNYGSSDTTWAKVECPTYKNPTSFWTVNLATTDFTWHGAGGNVVIICDSTSDKKFKKQIKRQHICMVPDRQVEPWSEHFWNWLKTKT